MVSKELVGSRIRQVRTKQRKTLKEVEAASGFSSTHISEIERGRTSPTIGALIRIAHALDKDPSFFVEERELDEVCVTTPKERPEAAPAFEVTGQGMSLTSLTRGILGGRLMAHEMILEPTGSVRLSRLPGNGDVNLICLEGGCEVSLSDGAVAFGPGDSLHLCGSDANLTLRASTERETRILLMVDPREAIQ